MTTEEAIAQAKLQVTRAQTKANEATTLLDAPYNAAGASLAERQARIAAVAMASIAHSLAAAVTLAVVALEEDRP